MKWVRKENSTWMTFVYIRTVTSTEVFLPPYVVIKYTCVAPKWRITFRHRERDRRTGATLTAS